MIRRERADVEAEPGRTSTSGPSKRRKTWPSRRFLDLLPIWAVFPVSIAVVLLSLEVGVLLGRGVQHSSADTLDVSGAMVGATMGLLAFMLAFTFNSTADRHQARKTVVIDEANAIGTTWLRAGFIAEPSRTHMRGLLRDYVDLRVKAVAGDLEQGDALRQLDALQERMWIDAAEAGRTESGSIVIGLFVQSLNEMIDLHLKRLTVAVRNRVPPAISLTLYLLMAVAMIMMGIQIGHSGTRSVGLEVALATSFSMVLYLISDLDRPQEGLVRVSQQAMLDLQAKLNGQ